MINNKTKKAKGESFKANSDSNLKEQFKTVLHTDADVVKVKEINNDIEFKDTAVENHKKRKSDTITLAIPRKLFSSPEVVSMIDRTQISRRKLLE